MSTSAQTEPLHTSYRPIRSISVSGLRQMYEVFAACHDEPSLDVFIRELGQKSGAVIMRRKRDDRIVGFATQTVSRQDVDGRSVLTVLSDDVVVLPAYWPQCDLGEALRAMLLQLKLRHPLTQVYWCQLARHFRSYLLMADHAQKVFPGPAGADARQRRVAQMLGKQLFPEAFDSKKMLLSFSGDHIVRPNLAITDITPALAAQDPRIALFKKLNPGWRRGTALLGVTAFDTPSLIDAAHSGFLRWIRLHILRNYRNPQQARSASASQTTSQQQASWQDSSLDEALERGETS